MTDVTTHNDSTFTAEREQRKNYLPLMLVISAIIIALDRLTKWLIVKNLPSGETHTVIPGVFRISHVLNTGAAFSAFADSASPLTVRNGLIFFSVVAVGIVGWMLYRVRHELTPTSFALALILGGAIGNLYDRAIYHYVIDFLEVTIVHYHWPDFNVADSAIVVGACLLMIELFRPQNENQV
jgi:signal peptidase II